MNKKLLPIILFNALYIAVSIPLALSKGNTEFLFYILVMFVFIALVATVHIRVSLSYCSLWFLSIWGLMHMAGGLINVPGSWPTNNSSVLYSLWIIPHYLKYDNIVHAFGFGVTTWVCWQALARMVSVNDILPKPTIGKLTLSIAAGLGFGALNEIFEFIATLFISDTNVGGYINTGWDLVANLTGAIITAILIRLNYKTVKPR